MNSTFTKLLSSILSDVRAHAATSLRFQYTRLIFLPAVLLKIFVDQLSSQNFLFGLRNQGVTLQNDRIFITVLVKICPKLRC